MDCLRSCHSIPIGFKSGLGHSKTLILFLLSQSEVDLPVCLRSLSCCITQVRLSLRSQTDAQTFSFRIFLWGAEFMIPSIMISHPGPEAAKQPQTITLPPPCLTWYDVLFMKCGVGFTPDVTGHTHLPKVQLLSHQSTKYFPKSLGRKFRIFLTNVRRAFVFFLVSNGFCLRTFPWMPFLPSLLLIVDHEY